MLEQLGFNGGIAIVILIIMYFTIKLAVKNGVREAFNIEDEMNVREMEKAQNLYNYIKNKRV